MLQENNQPDDMKSFIKTNIHQAETLEQTYRKNKSVFTRAFHEVWPDIQHHETAKVWQIRLQADQVTAHLGNTGDWIRIIGMILLAGCIAKLPDIFGWTQDEYYQRNVTFIVFPFMLAHYYFKGYNQLKSLLATLVVFILLAAYINLFYTQFSLDVITLVCLHLPVLAWGLAGYFRSGNTIFSTTKWIEFLRLNADIIIMSGLLLLSGLLLTAITVGLFKVIGWELEFFITKYWLVWGLPAIPILGVFFVQNSPELVHKISPLIARVFAPIVLVMLTGFVISTMISGQNPYEDRDFLIIFNVVLLGVMALIFFSLADDTAREKNKWFSIIITALALMTIVVNGIAVSAIIFRISSWGFTPNRVAILGSNLLMLAHLSWISTVLIQFVTGKKGEEAIHQAVVYFLPLYFIWACFVVFGFPIIFP